MPWRMGRSVETLLRLTPAVLGSTVFSVVGLCAAFESARELFSVQRQTWRG